MAVDNNICLELGIAGVGVPADNHHAGAMHPEYDPNVNGYLSTQLKQL